MADEKITIGILGANGQVGSELSIILSKMGNINVVPICRTRFASFFLRDNGINCRHGSLKDPQEAKELLKDCDLIADFTYLNGLPSEIKKTSEKLITNAIKYAPTQACYVFASSMMAFGMSKNNKVIKDYLIAHSVYGAMKRFSEKETIKQGKKHKRKIYILRLGQVHGELQEVSRKILSEIQDRTTIVPMGNSYTVFIPTIAEALLNIAKQKVEPGIYTLVSSPELTWKELHEYYCKKIGINPSIIEVSMLNNKNTKQLILNYIYKLAVKYTEEIASYLLIHFPSLEKRMMALYYINKARSQTQITNNTNIYNPYKDIFIGKLPGKRIKT